MERPWHVWSTYIACLAVAAMALGWLTFRAVLLDRAEAVVRGQMAVEENARLALWRMDSAMATLVAQESARPWFEYLPFHGDPPSAKGSGKSSAGMPSPLLSEPTPLVRLHFQIDRAGAVSSPRAPRGAGEKAIAVPRFLSQQDVKHSQFLCAQIQESVDLPRLIDELPEPQARTNWQFVGNEEQQSSSPPVQIAQQDIAQPQQQAAEQQKKNRQEYQARSQYLSSNAFNGNWVNALPAIDSPVEESSAVMTPVWAGEELLLARKVMMNNVLVIQACWLDLPVIKAQLLSSVRDLLPAADLQPVRANAVDQSHLLASLPLHLLPGVLPGPSSASISPMQLALLTAWTAFGVAAVAVALLLSGVVSLSERRASFVSAVTHELRTPLTTFRLYSEMLAEGMVPDEAARGRYLETLRSEADRLMHLVENVLAYARLERGPLNGRIVPVRVEQILERAESRLTTRSRQADLHLQIDVEPEILATEVLADASAVEQILFNLVDNACKYAASAQDRTLVLSAQKGERQIAICVQDHGPGISQPERARLFRPFHKSAHEAAVSAPGVGLGLALSRRLARALGGDLRLVPSTDGTRFSLLLNLASR